MRSFDTWDEFSEWKRKCGNKRKHDTPERAARSRMEMAVRRSDITLLDELEIYRCGYCSGWHLGRRKRNKICEKLARERAEKQHRKRVFREALEQPRYQPRVLP